MAAHSPHLLHVSVFMFGRANTCEDVVVCLPLECTWVYFKHAFIWRLSPGGCGRTWGAERGIGRETAIPGEKRK